MSLRASSTGQKRLKEVRQRISDNQWCHEVSKAMHPDRDWGKQDSLAPGCSITTLKNLLAGKAINEHVFKQFCRVAGLDWEEIVAQEVNEASFMEEFWIGRKSLITQLTEKLIHCRILVLTGITGIGKTALAYQLTKIRKEAGLKRSQSINFEDEDRVNFSNTAADLLIRFGIFPTLEERQEPRQLMDQLLKQLQHSHLILQLDSLERLLQGDEETGWNNFFDHIWLEFFQEFLTLSQCNSQIVITSQAFPSEFQEIAGAKYIFCSTLSGLEPLEQLALFEKTDLDVDPESEDRILLKRIGAAYEGHPLALLVIAGEIWSTEFDGKVSAYWQKYGHEIEEVERSNSSPNIQGENDKLRLDRFSRRLKELIKRRIEESFVRLAQELPDAYQLLCVASCFRQSVPYQAWFKTFLKYLQYDENKLIIAMEGLLDRYLVEVEPYINNRKLVRLHNLIRSVAIQHCKRIKVRLPNHE